MRNLGLLACAALVMLLQSCVSTATMQTGRTVGEGKSSFTTSVGQVGNDTLRLPFMDLRYTYGITEKLDASAFLTLLGPGGLGVKYQFLGDGESQTAVSVGLQFAAIKFSNIFIRDFSIPVYASYHVSEKFAFYGAPRFNLSMFSIENSFDGSKGAITTFGVGSTFGFKLGGRNSLMMEYSFMKINNLDDNVSELLPMTQFMIGVGRGIR